MTKVLKNKPKTKKDDGYKIVRWEEVGRNKDGTFAIGNKLQRQKPLLVGDFLDAVAHVGNEFGVPILVQAIRMAYSDAKLMGKVLDKFVSNAGDKDLDKKEAIQIIIQNYLGQQTDEKVIEIDVIK